MKVDDDFTFNDDVIWAATDRAWANIAAKCGVAAREAIGLVRYEYPRTTVRRSGEIAGSPRNKIDSGNLQRNQRLVIIDDDEFALVNDAPYAPRVHEGEEELDRPPQEWLKEAISAGADGDPEWQNPNALVNVPDEFAIAFRTVINL